jgi:hypothetical protein
MSVTELVQRAGSGGVNGSEHQAGATVLGPNDNRGKAAESFVTLGSELDRDIDGCVEVESNRRRINRYSLETYIADSAKHNPKRWVAEDGFACNLFAGVQTVLYRHVLRLLALGAAASGKEKRGAHE